ncbi:MAG: MBL fold metallo-hydrolase [Alphaproteobacteria bacterium]|nr:MBL fold metallo-hydrolase [Alphaproteobacteria bacterium]
MRITILGSGSAGGVPMIGNQWGACDPANPKNRRRRASILVEQGEAALLVDTGPDVREQLIDARVMRLDGILYTHTHADHTHGIDEIRALNRLQRMVIPAYGTENDLGLLMKKFSYIFDEPGEYNGKIAFYKPCLEAHVLTHGAALNIAGIPVLPFEQDHGFMVSTGYRFGPIAYTTDAVELPEQAFEALSGIDTWIIGCLQHEPHPTHAHLARILEWINRVGPRRSVLTHLSMRIDYDELSARLPDNVVAGYDGMVVEPGVDRPN